MDQHANQMDQSSIADLPHPQLPPHPHPHPQLPPHPHPHPQLPPYPHPLPQHQHLGPYHPAMYQHAYRPVAPPPPYHGYAPGLVPYYPSAPSTVQYQMQGYEQQLEQGPVQHAPEGSSHRIFHHKYHDFELVVGKLLYKCPLLHCGEEIKGTSIRNHLTTNKHLNQSGQLPCPYCGKKLSRGDSVTRHIKSCEEAQENADTVPQGPGAAPATVVVQPTIAVPQAQSTLQMVWDPRSELTSGTQQSLPSTENATSLAHSSAAPVTADEDDDTAWGESLEHDYNNLESDAVPGHFDDAEDSSSGDKALYNLLNSLDWD